MSDIVERLKKGEPCVGGCGAPCKVMDTASGCTCAEAAAEIERLRAALDGVLWMAEDWYQYGGDETTFADDYKKELDEARAALAEEKKG